MFRLATWIYVILLGLVGFLAFEIVQVWNRPVASGVREAPQPRPTPEAQTAPPPASGGQEAGLKPKEAYQVVALKNPFRPSRTDWGGTGKRVDRPKVFLYGVTLAGEYKAALLATGPPGKGRGARLYKLGDQVGGYTVKEVLADRVMLAMGEDTFPVLLHDAGKPKSAAAAPPTAPATSPAPPMAVRAPGVPPPSEVQPPVAPEDRRKLREERRRQRLQRPGDG